MPILTKFQMCRIINITWELQAFFFEIFYMEFLQWHYRYGHGKQFKNIDPIVECLLLINRRNTHSIENYLLKIIKKLARWMQQYTSGI